MRYTYSEVEQSKFWQFPKFLMDDQYRNLPNDAKILYMLLKDRHELSLKNNWRNDKGEIYIIFTREDMCQLLGKSEKTVIKLFKQLVCSGLCEEERQGQMKPNLIFLCKPDSIEYEKQEMDTCDDIDDSGNHENDGDIAGEFRPVEITGHDPQELQVMSGKNYSSRAVKTTGHDPQNLQPNKTDINKTNNSKTDIIKTDIFSGGGVSGAGLNSEKVTREVFKTYCSRRETAQDVEFVRSYLSCTDAFGCSQQDMTGLLEYAFKCAVAKSKPGDWDYINGVMQKLKEREFTTATEAMAYDEFREIIMTGKDLGSLQKQTTDESKIYRMFRDCKFIMRTQKRRGTIDRDWPYGDTQKRIFENIVST